MSHKGPLVVALAASRAVGVDLERIDVVDDRLQDRVLTDAERARLPSGGSARTRAIVAHFSIKEAVYKSLTELDQDGLEFDAIDTALGPARPDGEWSAVDVHFSTRACAVQAAIMFDGRWLVSAARRGSPLP